MKDSDGSDSQPGPRESTLARPVDLDSERAKNLQQNRITAALAAAIAGTVGTIGSLFSDRIAYNLGPLVSLTFLAFAAVILFSWFRAKEQVAQSSRITEHWSSGGNPRSADHGEPEVLAAYMNGFGWIIESRLRVLGQVRVHERRADLALYIAASASAFGLAVLTIVVFGEGARLSFERWADALIYLGPRVSLILAAEYGALVSYQVFKESLREVRYYSNELMNLEMRGAALAATTMPLSGEHAAEIVSAMGKTERNLRLSKDETTVELEEAKARGAAQKDLLTAFQAVLNFKK